jgi:F420-dependent oxidoreductase-like protein
MKLGLALGYWGLGPTAQEQLEAVREAEKLGFDSVWAAEAYGSDVVSVLAWLAAQTSTIKLGAGIMQIPARSAAMTAMSAATLDHLSDGRFVLGLGTSGPQVSEGWHGVRFGKQLGRTRDYVSVVRRALRRERLSYQGETLELPLPDGPGKALKLTIGTVQDEIPIVLAAIGPKNTALAGECFDGLVPILLSPDHMDGIVGHLEDGWAKREGGRPDDFQILPTVTVLIDDDIDKARDAMRGYVALYVGGMGSKEKNFYARLAGSYGFEEAAGKVQDLFLAGKREEAMAALPAELIDAVCLVGPADQVRERLVAYKEAGVTTLVASPMAFAPEERLGQLRQLAELAP